MRMQFENWGDANGRGRRFALSVGAVRGNPQAEKWIGKDGSIVVAPRAPRSIQYAWAALEEVWKEVEASLLDRGCSNFNEVVVVFLVDDSGCQGPMPTF